MSKLVLRKLCKNTNKRSLEKKKKTPLPPKNHTLHQKKHPKTEPPIASRDWQAEVSALELFLWTDSKSLGEKLKMEAKVHSN